MSFLRSIGDRLKDAAGIGARLVRGAANIGGRISSTANEFLDKAEQVPILGGALQAIPGYATGRAAVDTLGTVSSIGRNVAKGLDKFAAGDIDKGMQIGQVAVSKAMKLPSQFEKAKRDRGGGGGMYE